MIALLLRSEGSFLVALDLQPMVFVQESVHQAAVFQVDLAALLVVAQVYQVAAFQADLAVLLVVLSAVAQIALPAAVDLVEVPYAIASAVIL